MPIPMIKGSTVQILRALYESAMDLKKALPSDGVILLDAKAASMRAKMPEVQAIVSVRDNIDNLFPAFKPEDMKTIGMMHKQTSIALSPKIDELETQRKTLLDQYAGIKEAHHKIRELLDEGKKPSAEEISALQSKTKQFVDLSKKYNDSHASVLNSFVTLESAVAKYVPVAQQPSSPYQTPTASA